jgi:hypothetical protein
MGSLSTRDGRIKVKPRLVSCRRADILDRAMSSIQNVNGACHYHARAGS